MLALPYTLRVLCVTLIGLGITHAFFDLMLRLSSPGCMRALYRQTSRFQERFFFFLMLFPPLLAGLLAFLVITPTFVSQEKNHLPEDTDVLCILAAVVIGAWYFTSLIRAVQAMIRTIFFENSLRQAAKRRLIRKRPAWVVSSNRPLLALVGLIRPKILLSENLLDPYVLQPDVLEIALRHEDAHARHYDNWKLLIASLIPRLPITSSRLPSLQETWSRYSEWAADDAATADHRESSLLLAESLLFFARSSEPLSQSILATELAGPSRELSLRIWRLLAERQLVEIHDRRALALPLALIAFCLSVAASAGVFLFLVHGATECLLHFG